MFLKNGELDINDENFWNLLKEMDQKVRIYTSTFLHSATDIQLRAFEQAINNSISCTLGEIRTLRKTRERLNSV